jgi:hypothetical protein
MNKIHNTRMMAPSRKRIADGNIKSAKKPNTDAHREAIQLPRHLFTTGQALDLAADVLKRRIAALEISANATTRRSDTQASIQATNTIIAKDGTSAWKVRDALDTSCPAHLEPKDEIIR